MKRFIALVLIFICLIFNATGVKTVFADNTFKEGVYKLSDFNPSKKGIYVFSNISLADNIYLMVIDENEVVHYSILLPPNSEKHVTVPILPGYRVVLLGKGELYLYPQEP
jgi:hypothetical protein